MGIKALENEERREEKHLEQLNLKASAKLAKHILAQKDQLFRQVDRQNREKYESQKRLARIRRLEESELKELQLIYRNIEE